MTQTKTNETTRNILNFLIGERVFAWRQNVLPIPVLKNGVLTGYRAGGKSGLPDICGVISPKGTFLGVEVKTGRDKLRDEQFGFHRQARMCGALILVVSDFADFKRQWYELSKPSGEMPG